MGMRSVPPRPWRPSVPPPYPVKSAQEIHQLYLQRWRHRGQEIARIERLARFANGDVIVPLPELDASEKPAVANLIAQGIDQLGVRVGGRLPDVAFPAARPGVPLSERKAANQRSAVLAWWDMNRMDKKMLRRGRLLVGYGEAPVIVKPVSVGDKRQIPHWHVLNPLHVFPGPTPDPDCITPPDVIVRRQKSLGWLTQHYPQQMAVLYKGQDPRVDMMFDLLEYNDEEETVLIVLGAMRDVRDRTDSNTGSSPEMVLERDANRAGMCLGVAPTGITIDKLSGHFDGILGMFFAQAKLTALEIISVSRSIFPDEWVVSHPNSPIAPRIVQYADGKQGIIGEIENGQIQVTQVQPSQLASQAIDRLERAQRVQGGIPSDWGGESSDNIRTAKRGQQVAASASDPYIGECQTIFAESMEAENERAIAVAKGWYGSKMTSFYVPRSGKPTNDDYSPNALFDSDFHFVKFSMPGVDAAGIPIELGQRTGTGEMSMATARRSDPMIDDPDFEDRQVIVEGLRTGLLKGLEMQAGQPGALDPHEFALIIQKVQTGRQSLEEAVIEAQAALQQQQADLQQAQPGSPETQPGMAQAAPPGAPQAGGPPPLAQMLQSLRSPTQQSPAETGLTAPPAQ
jgi:hypothetical protein